MTTQAADKDLPAYISHKTVYALRIRTIEQVWLEGEQRSATMLVPEDPAFRPFELTREYLSKHNPQAGGYWIRYQDGYESWSPAEPFEAGCLPRQLWGVRRSQEPKYGIDNHGKLMNRHTGYAIPDQEPIFIFRAKDKLLPAVLEFYLSQLPEGEHKDEVEQRLRAVRGFQEGYRDRVRMPDGNGPTPPVPHSISTTEQPKG